MELDIHGVSGLNAGKMTAQQISKDSAQKKAETADALRRQAAASSEQLKHIKEQHQKESESRKSGKEIEEYLNEILRISSLFDRKLKFVLDRDAGTIIVKVIDKRTDKVIKEIPPESLQKLHSSMKEAIGLLIDEEI